MSKIFLALIGIIIFGTSIANIANAQEAGLSQSRLDEIVNSKPLALSEQEQQKITTNCKNTQNTLKAMQLTTDTAVRKRLLVYTDIQKELKSIEIRISRQGADASELDLLIGDIQQELNDFNTNSRLHNLLINDMVNVDCQKLPLHFKVGIDELRSVRGQLLGNAQQMKTSVTESNQTTFIPLIDRLTI